MPAINLVNVRSSLYRSAEFQSSDDPRNSSALQMDFDTVPKIRHLWEMWHVVRISDVVHPPMPKDRFLL